MPANKNAATSVPVVAFLGNIELERKREEAFALLDLFKRTTGWNPVMWGPSIVGFGRYHYKYASGREGDFMATGFSPRKAQHSIYIMPGYADYGPILARLGKHTTGKSCLYVRKLADIDPDVLSELIRTGLRDLSEKYPVEPS